MRYWHSTFPTVFGRFSVALDNEDALIATAFGDHAALRRRMPVGFATGSGVRNDHRAARVRNAVLAYASGLAKRFDVPIRAIGTEFQRRVWAELQAIPWGETRTYGQLARTLGTSPRAVGRANATNPICLLIPCHRVVGGDGALTGFAFGEPLKAQLLAHEGLEATGAGPRVAGLSVATAGSVRGAGREDC